MPSRKTSSEKRERLSKAPRGGFAPWQEKIWRLSGR